MSDFEDKFTDFLKKHLPKDAYCDLHMIFEKNGIEYNVQLDIHEEQKTEYPPKDKILKDKKSFVRYLEEHPGKWLPADIPELFLKGFYKVDEQDEVIDMVYLSILWANS